MRDNPTMIIHTAFTEGREVYDRLGGSYYW
jgi:hypothetical protein